MSDETLNWIEIVAKSLLETLKNRDPYTYGHCRRVARNARLLAQAIGLSEAEQKVIEYSSLFHDLGKLGIPDKILLKKGKLTPSEELIMQEHPLRSVKILEPLTGVPFFKDLVPGVKHHHERMDGKGYPDGIQGDEIPLPARIILIADTFDAMTTNRPYRKGREPEFAYKELKLFSGRQFDPKLVEAFLKAHPTWGEIEKEIREETIASRSRRVA